MNCAWVTGWPEASQGKEREAFTVSEMVSNLTSRSPCGRSGERVVLTVRGDLRAGERLIRVGSRAPSTGGAWQRIRNEIPAGTRFGRKFRGGEWSLRGRPGAKPAKADGAETLIVKIGRVGQLAEAFGHQS